MNHLDLAELWNWLKYNKGQLEKAVSGTSCPNHLKRFTMRCGSTLSSQSLEKQS
jgi:hypothetical protein